jgi:hypothetical protein
MAAWLTHSHNTDFHNHVQSGFDVPGIMFCTLEGGFACTGVQLVRLPHVQGFIEDAFWQNYKFDAESLAVLPADTFKESLIIKDSIGYRRKYLWDFFNPHYSCPLKEKIGILAVC